MEVVGRGTRPSGAPTSLPQLAATGVVVGRYRSQSVFSNPEFVGITKAPGNFKDQALYILGPYARHCFIVIVPCFLVGILCIFITNYRVPPEFDSFLTNENADITDGLRASTWSVLINIQAVQYTERIFLPIFLMTTLHFRHKLKQFRQDPIFCSWRTVIVVSAIVGAVIGLSPFYVPLLLDLTQENISSSASYRSFYKLILAWQISETLWWMYWVGLLQTIQMNQELQVPANTGASSTSPPKEQEKVAAAVRDSEEKREESNSPRHSQRGGRAQRVNVYAMLCRILGRAALYGMPMSFLWTTLHVVSLGPFVSRAIAPKWFQLIFVCFLTPFNNVFSYHFVSKMVNQFALDAIKVGDQQQKRLNFVTSSLVMQCGLLHTAFLLLLTSDVIAMSLFGMLASKALDIILQWDKSRKLFQQFKTSFLRQQQLQRTLIRGAGGIIALGGEETASASVLKQREEGGQDSSNNPVNTAEDTAKSTSKATPDLDKLFLRSDKGAPTIGNSKLSSSSILSVVTIPDTLAVISPTRTENIKLVSVKKVAVSIKETNAVTPRPNGGGETTAIDGEGNVARGYSPAEPSKPRSPVDLAGRGEPIGLPSSGNSGQGEDNNTACTMIPVAPLSYKKIAPSPVLASVRPLEPGSIPSAVIPAASSSTAFPMSMTRQISEDSKVKLNEALAEASLVLQDDIANQPTGNILACALATGQVFANRVSGHWWWSMGRFVGTEAWVAYPLMFLQEILGCFFIFYLMRRAKFCDLTKAKLIHGLYIIDVIFFCSYATMCNQLYMEMGHYTKLIVLANQKDT